MSHMTLRAKILWGLVFAIWIAGIIYVAFE